MYLALDWQAGTAHKLIMMYVNKLGPGLACRDGEHANNDVC